METVTPDQALDLPTRGNLVIVCFACDQDVGPVARYCARHGARLNLRAVRVDPTEQHAIALECSRHPTFTLFVRGNERTRVTGTDGFMAWLEQHAGSL
jgi:hypothetical protein